MYVRPRIPASVCCQYLSISIDLPPSTDNGMTVDPRDPSKQGILRYTTEWAGYRRVPHTGISDSMIYGIPVLAGAGMLYFLVIYYENYRSFI